MNSYNFWTKTDFAILISSNVGALRTQNNKGDEWHESFQINVRLWILNFSMQILVESFRRIRLIILGYNKLFTKLAKANVLQQWLNNWTIRINDEIVTTPRRLSKGEKSNSNLKYRRFSILEMLRKTKSWA